MTIDAFWVAIWVLLGLFAFEIPQLVPFLKDSVTVFSTILALNIFLRIGLSGGTFLGNQILTSFASTLGYLFGANISRAKVTGKISLKNILIYGIILIFLLRKFL